MYARHEEHSAPINASPERVFDQLDDQARLSEHMSKRSWRMGWERMETVLDAQRGRSVGSHIVVHGRVFGIRLYLDEVVIMREPPLRKTWETVGEPRLLVIGPYRIGFRPGAGRKYLAGPCRDRLRAAGQGDLAPARPAIRAIVREVVHAANGAGRAALLRHVSGLFTP